MIERTPAAATSISAFRYCGCASRRGLTYSAVMEWSGPDAVSVVLTASRGVEGVLCPVPVDKPHPLGSWCEEHVGVLDLRDQNGVIVDDRCIPTWAAWNWWVGAVELRPAPDPADCPSCHCPDCSPLDGADQAQAQARRRGLCGLRPPFSVDAGSAAFEVAIENPARHPPFMEGPTDEPATHPWARGRPRPQRPGGR